MIAGDCGRSWMPLERANSFIHWTFPDAPHAPVSCNNGFQMPSWFDIETIPLEVGCRDYESDVMKSIKRIHAIIKSIENEGTPSKMIAVGGFSQGGALSLLSVLSYPKPLAGAIVASGWLMLESMLPKLIQPANINTPILWMHGKSDPVVVFDQQNYGVSTLKKNGSVF